MSQDREFESYMQGKSGLSDLYADLPQDKLPAHLDAAILAEAHRAVGARPGAKPRRSWVIPLSMAASLFVVVIIGLQLPYLLPGQAVPSRVDREERRGEERQKAATVERAVPDKSVPPAAAPVPAATTGEQEQRRSRAPVSNRLENAAEPVPLAPAAKGSPNAAAPQGRAPEPAAVMAKPAPAVEAKPMGAMRVAPAAPAEAPPVAAEEPARLFEQAESGNRAALKKEKKAYSRGEDHVADYAAPPAPAAATMAEASGQVSEPMGEAKADMASAPPKEWLARIRQLRHQGKLDEAKKELAAFRKRYPDYPVPKDMEMR